MAEKSAPPVQAMPPERTREDMMQSLTWSGPARVGGELRIYDAAGSPLTPEQVAARDAPSETVGLSVAFTARR